MRCYCAGWLLALVTARSQFSLKTGVVITQHIFRPFDDNSPRYACFVQLTFVLQLTKNVRGCGQQDGFEIVVLGCSVLQARHGMEKYGSYQVFGWKGVGFCDQLKYSPPIAKRVGVVTEVMWPQAWWMGVVTEVVYMCTYVRVAIISAACARKFGGKIKFTGNSF